MTERLFDNFQEIVSQVYLKLQIINIYIHVYHVYQKGR